MNYKKIIRRYQLMSEIMKIEGKPVVNYIYFLGEKVTDEKIKAPTEVKADQRFTQWISTNTPYRSISAYAKYVGYFTGYETNDGTIYINANNGELRKNSEYVSFGGEFVPSSVIEYFPEEDNLDEALYGKKEIAEFFSLCDKLGLKTFGDLQNFADTNRNRIIVNNLLKDYDLTMSTDAFFETLRDRVKEMPNDEFKYDDPLNVIKNRNKNESLDDNNTKNSIEVEVKSGINGDGFKVIVKDTDGSIIEQDDFHYGYNASYNKSWADKDKPFVTDIINSYLSKYNLSKDDLVLTKGKNTFKDTDVSDETITRFKTDYLSEGLTEEVDSSHSDFVIKNGILEKYTGNESDVVIPTSVTRIGRYAFFWCDSLTSVVIPTSVTRIGRSAFSSCDSLTSIVIPDSVTRIDDWAFHNCNSLTSIEIPNSVTKIDFFAFRHCTSLKSVVIGDSVESIGDGAFWDCTSLTNIKIPNSVTYVGDHAFKNCRSLRSIVIPDSVTYIGKEAFYDCRSLRSINYNGTKEEWNDIGYGWSRESAISKVICTDGVISLKLGESLTDDIDSKLIHLVQSKLPGPLADRAGSSNFYSENGQRFMVIPVSTNSDSFDFESYKQDLKKYVFPNSDIYAMMNDYEIVIDVTDFYRECNLIEASTNST
jgi:hypothetical protein